MSRRRKDKNRTRTSLVGLVPFLFGYVRPYWRLVVAAAVVTAIYSGFHAARAPLLGVFAGKVLLPGAQALPFGAAGPGDAVEEDTAREPAPPAMREPPPGAADTEPGAADAAPATWLDEHVPFVAEVRGWWRVKQAELDWRQWLAVCAGLLATIAVGLAFTNVWRLVLQQALVLRVLIAIRVHVSAHLLKQSLRYFSRQKLGDLYSRLTNDIGQVHHALIFLFVDIFEALLLLVTYVAVCLYTSWKLSLTAALITPPIFLVMRYFGRKIRRRARGRQVSQAEVTEEMQQMLTGVRTVKAFDNERYQVARFERANEGFFRRALRVVRIKATSRGFVDVLNHWAIALLVLIGLWYALDRKLISFADLITVVGAIVLMYEPAKKLVRAYNSISDALAAVDRVRELLALTPEITDDPDAVPLPDVRGDLAVEGVSFAYDTEPVLREVSLKARAGEVVALVGESGAGKSTLVDLLARLYDPDGGRVLVDGHDLRRVRRGDYMRRVAMVTQEPFLFNDTVAENLRYARRDATLEEMEAACRAANIHDVIAALEQGYETALGERGATLSGGQRQRLTIARALLRDPRVLLLDEATSALDSESERLVQEALERLMKGRTTVVVAHRLSTIMGADRIVVLEKGRVIEQGTHAELVGRGGRYARFHALQTESGRTSGAG